MVWFALNEFPAAGLWVAVCLAPSWTVSGARTESHVFIPASSIIFKRHFYYSKCSSPELLYIETNPSQLPGSMWSSSFTGYLRVVVPPAAWQSRSWFIPQLCSCLGAAVVAAAEEAIFLNLWKYIVGFYVSIIFISVLSMS